MDFIEPMNERSRQRFMNSPKSVAHDNFFQCQGADESLIIQSNYS